MLQYRITHQNIILHTRTTRQMTLNMHISRTFSSIVLLTFTLLFSACASSGKMSDAPASSQDTQEMEDLFWARQEAARSRFVQADVDFMTGMIGHHAQALVMSAMAEKNGAGSEIMTLTSRITNAQKDEIATMQGWLRDRGQTVPEIHIDGKMLMVHGAGDHAMHMPGMLTQDQLDELDAAKGPDFDRLFLKYMIQHHQGAVAMVKVLFATDGAGQDELSFKVANDINVDKLTEIARMELMLKARTGTN